MVPYSDEVPIKGHQGSWILCVRHCPGYVMAASTIETKDVLFPEFDLPHEVLKGIEAAGFTACTPIQALSFPLILKGNDIHCVGQTC